MRSPPCCHSWHERRFKVRRRHVAQRRVQPLSIVDLLDEAPDGAACLVGCSVFAPIDLLALERAPEALRFGVVIRRADSAHALLNAVNRQQRAVLGTGVLGGFNWSSQQLEEEELRWPQGGCAALIGRS